MIENTCELRYKRKGCQTTRSKIDEHIFFDTSGRKYGGSNIYGLSNCQFLTVLLESKINPQT